MENKIQKLPPFIRFCYTIGMIPTSYKISMTYEEQLLWLCDFLENTVIPTVNNNGKAVEELQKLFEELTNYVTHYFDTLDIQTEINNKLDEMAESGELADIIAQYLNLACLLVYDTKTDLKNANNLVNGSIAMTIGENSFNDGIKNYYKIRNITSSDIIDDNNILQLAESNTLIAERIELSTKLNVVNSLPINKENNSEYEVLKFEEINDMISIPDSEFQYVYNAKQEQLQNEPQNILKVATWNIHNTDVPYTHRIWALKKYDTVRKICDKLGCQAMALNEIHDGLLYKATDLFLTNFYRFFNMIKTLVDVKPLLNQGEAVITPIEPSATDEGIYTEFQTERQGWKKVVLSYNNKTISFYCTHFSYNGGDVLRKSQIDELYSIIQNDTSTYKIIAGDFNFDLETNKELLSSFTNAGYKLVNDGNYPTFTSNRPIDEIMVSSNIDILERGTLTYDEISNISDHRPLFAKLELK